MNDKVAGRAEARKSDIIEYSEINQGSARSSGGKTGSTQVKIGDATYQYKPPIANNSFVRRTKAEDADNENFGEVIAARIAKAFDPDIHQARVPHVSFVVSKDSEHVAIASKYLTGTSVKPLDDHFDPNKKRETPHVKLTAKEDNPERGHYNIDKDPGLKKELAQAIALSALVGDHDVNPGNMMVITDQGQSRIGRIDYGHAFKDLMRFSNFGGETIHSNNIIDFFNRETVDGIRSKSKLWRDYPGLIPSKEMAEALTELAAQGKDNLKISGAINEVKKEVLEILENPNVDKQQVIRSFQRISEHVSGTKINPDLNDEDKIDAIFQGIEEYTHKNMNQMAYAAEIMSLQVNIQEAIKNQDDGKLGELKEKYNELSQNKDLGPFSWFKEDEKRPPFKGDFEQYVNYQSNKIKLSQVVEEAREFLKTNPPKNEESITRNLLAVSTNPKKSVEDKIQSLDSKVQNLSEDPQSKSNPFVRLINFVCEKLDLKSPFASKKALEEHNAEEPVQNKVQTFNSFKARLNTILQDSRSTTEPTPLAEPEDTSRFTPS